MTYGFSNRFIFGVLGSLTILAGLYWLISSRNHWKATAASNEQLYHGEQAAHQATVANYRAAAAQATQAAEENVARVKAEEATINERTTSEYEARIAAANRQYERLQQSSRAAAAHSSGPAAAPVSVVSEGTGSVAPASGQDELSADDALTATKQAIQLDELINWVEAQSAVETNPK